MARGTRNTDYETVAANQSEQVLGTVGKAGHLLERLVLTVTGASCAVSIKDGDGSAISIIPVSTPVGVHVVEFGMRAKNATTPGWKVTTLGGATALATGRFT